MPAGLNDEPEKLHVVFILTLLGTAAIVLIWAAVHGRAVRHVDVRPLDDAAPPYGTVEVVRGLVPSLKLISSRPHSPWESTRWPMPETLPLSHAERIVLLDTATQRVIDHADVSDTTFRGRHYAFEVGTSWSSFAVLACLMRMPLILLFCGVLAIFVLIAWFTPGQDRWWFVTWWVPGS